MDQKTHIHTGAYSVFYEKVDFGRTDPIIMLPYGTEAIIDCNAENIAIMGNTVMDRAAYPQTVVS